MQSIPPNLTNLSTRPQPAATGQPFLQRVFGRSKPAVQLNLVFVIMSFRGEGMDEVLAAIREECSVLGLQAKRADESVGSDFVIKEISELIEQAEFIVCDLSHGRPNVYYELGYAHGVGNEASNILLIAGDKTTLHFDIGPLRVHTYNSTDELRSILARNLKGMLQSSRKQIANPIIPEPDQPSATP